MKQPATDSEAKMSQDEPQAVKRKTAALTIRMTQDTREILDSAARREQRSVSEMAERWITIASRGEADYRERIRGAQIAETVEAMLSFTETIRAEIGDPRAYLPARDALLAGWGLIIDKALPYTPDTPEGARYRRAATNLRQLCKKAADLAAKKYANNPVTDAFMLAEPEGRSVNHLLGRFPTTKFGALRDAATHVSDQTLYGLEGWLTDLPEDLPGDLRAALDGVNDALGPVKEAYDAYMAPRMDAIIRGEMLAEEWRPGPVEGR